MPLSQEYPAGQRDWQSGGSVVLPNLAPPPQAASRKKERAGTDFK
jgi:hypothetical protein